MKTQTPGEKRFLNFPLFMLAKTIKDPERGLNDIFSFAIANYAQHTQPNNAVDALVQAGYVASQRPSETVPDDVQEILARDDVNDVIEALPENFLGRDGDGADFVQGAREMVAGIALTADEADTLVAWHGLRRAAAYFNRTINSYAGVKRVYGRVNDEKAEHEDRYGPTVWATVPADYASEVGKHGRDIDLFRCVAACRSIIGRHQFTGTTKSCIRMRMIGAKSKAAATELLQDEAIRDEYERLSRRRQFDNLLTDAVARGFFTKLAPSKKAGGLRRVYMSVALRTPGDLAAAINHANRRRAVRDAEADARVLIR